VLSNKLQNRHQSSAQYLVQLLSIRDSRRTAKVITCTLLGLSFIIFGKSCWAHENYRSLNNPAVATNGIHAKTSPTKLKSTLWWQIANRHQLDPYILYAVALVESAKSSGSTHVTPWPWSLNKSGKSIIPASQQEARILLNKTLAEGHRNIDVGLMQINLHWQGHRVDNPEQLLNPVINLQIGALVLAEAIHSVPNDLVLGIGRYHSWHNISAAVAYGRKVLAVAAQIRPVL